MISYFIILLSGAPNGSVPQNICCSGTFLLAGRCGRNNSPWKESVAGKKIFQGLRGDLKSRIAATGYMYGLLTTQDPNCTLWNFPVSQVAGCKVAGWELFHQSCWEWGTDNFFPAILIFFQQSRFVVVFRSFSQNFMLGAPVLSPYRSEQKIYIKFRNLRTTWLLKVTIKKSLFRNTRSIRFYYKLDSKQIIRGLRVVWGAS